jgi:hypothetical protein
MITNIKYIDVIRLGFKIEKANDNVYFNEYGFNYEIITFKLSENCEIDWAKESHKCEILKCDSEGNVLKKINIPNLEELQKIIEIYEIIKK